MIVTRSTAPGTSNARFGFDLEVGAVAALTTWPRGSEVNLPPRLGLSTVLLFATRSSVPASWWASLADGAQASACTRACIATAVTEATGACPAGSVCTTNWIQLGAAQTELAGCLPFCASDGDCAGLTEGDASLTGCNARTGRCGSATSEAALRADGMPCDPQEVQRTLVNQCRGVCFALDPARPTQGLCGSFIDLSAAAGGCPDGAEVEPSAVAGDALGLCYRRTCERNDQCAPGLVCVHPEDAATGVRVDAPRSCSYPTALQPGGTTGDAGVRADAPHLMARLAQPRGPPGCRPTGSGGCR